ncbi:hypothetical protein [Paraburkholderia phosphatilytica]|uniref:hypothetical protein n=1 Tax=Paraburkholderia phosphatilytica TaxID=2282883 RepID=UPI000E522D3A|nr:hypothetical protein [Paraburkholderia phosphatilytica]
MNQSASRSGALEQEAFDTWPPQIQTLLDGASLASKEGFTASLLVVDAKGQLRTTLLGIGELFAPDPLTVCFALWSHSRAARALMQGGRAGLTFVEGEAFYQIQLKVEPLPELDGEDGETALARFAGTIEIGEMQRVRYARLTHGISFELEAEEKHATLERWQAQIAGLKQAAAALPRAEGAE